MLLILGGILNHVIKRLGSFSAIPFRVGNLKVSEAFRAAKQAFWTVSEAFRT